MDMSLERDGGVIGTLFQQIINDMKVSTLLEIEMEFWTPVSRRAVKPSISDNPDFRY